TYPEAILYHYMDDILLASEDSESLLQLRTAVISTLNKKGFEISPEKIQLSAPWKYLGYKISEQTIQPMCVAIPETVRTLHDLQS
ncbi:PO113 protein, partial [Scytalopus superciliaris]|nr:PO113 protein [Scytalopus superciliaris]